MVDLLTVYSIYLPTYSGSRGKSMAGPIVSLVRPRRKTILGVNGKGKMRFRVGLSSSIVLESCGVGVRGGFSRRKRSSQTTKRGGATFAFSGMCSISNLGGAGMRRRSVIVPTSTTPKSCRLVM